MSPPSGCGGWSEAMTDYNVNKDPHEPIMLKDAIQGFTARMNESSKALNALAAFGAKVLELHRNGGEPGDVDYDDLHNAAITTGVLIQVDVTEPCREDCSCANYVGGDGFPTTCNRYAPGVKQIMQRANELYLMKEVKP